MRATAASWKPQCSEVAGSSGEVPGEEGLEGEVKVVVGVPEYAACTLKSLLT